MCTESLTPLGLDRFPAPGGRRTMLRLCSQAWGLRKGALGTPVQSPISQKVQGSHSSSASVYSLQIKFLLESSCITLQLASPVWLVLLSNFCSSPSPPPVPVDSSVKPVDGDFQTRAPCHRNSGNRRIHRWQVLSVRQDTDCSAMQAELNRRLEI